MKSISLLLTVLFFFVKITAAQTSAEKEIRALMASQNADWNNGDLEGFMMGYWENDSLMFIGQSGITYGYKKTLDNYKKGYPDTAAMGKLRFELLEFRPLSKEYYFVVGKWFLTRSIGNVKGAFSLLFRKIKGRWVIIADHSS